MSFLDAVLSPITSLVGGVGSIIDNLHTSDAEKLEAKRKILDLQTSFQVAMAEAEAKRMSAQASVIVAEVASQSWMASNWRPLLMMSFTYIIVHNFILVPVLSAFLPIEVVPTPDRLWDLLEIGIGGYIGGRTVEKVAPLVAEAFKRPKK